MLFAQEKRRWLAAENANENNQRVSSHLGKLWRTLGATDKEPYQRKAAEAATVHQRKYLDYMYNARKARWRKEQERSTKKIAGKLNNDSSGNQEQQSSPSTAATHGRGTPECQQQQQDLPLSRPPQMKKRCATSAAWGGACSTGQKTPLSISRPPLSRPQRRITRLRGPTACTSSAVLCHRHCVGRTGAAWRNLKQLAHSASPMNAINQLSPALLDEDEYNDSSVDSTSFDRAGGFLDTLGSADDAAGQSQLSGSTAA
ncbi:hypothetical protein HPB49_009008 [Dermacentor silvarum]|uniref:Uncharacterized protein n=1 Tax=Dermacentor silvarum TaxID=543639 RepID=A0ACB8DXQ2_DERSI|nr:sex-determining region Y protein [Dermacentor silvarum]KAH7979307.1 hypothetical protein HPB49_009008 [Dermacentor silvarum]